VHRSTPSRCGTSYQIGPFEVEWIQVNDAIADACALRVSTPEGTIIYTSSYKLDQTPVDHRYLTSPGWLKLVMQAFALIGDSTVQKLPVTLLPNVLWNVACSKRSNAHRDGRLLYCRERIRIDCKFFSISPSDRTAKS